MAKDLRERRQSYTLVLLQAACQWRRAADAIVKKQGVSGATSLPLLMIGRSEGEPRQATLAEAMGIEPSLVRLLDQLCAAGLVVRQEDPTDRRAKLLNFTEYGQATVSKLAANLTALHETIFANVSTDLEASLRVFQALQDYTRQSGNRVTARFGTEQKEPAE